MEQATFCLLMDVFHQYQTIAGYVDDEEGVFQAIAENLHSEASPKVTVVITTSNPKTRK